MQKLEDPEEILKRTLDEREKLVVVLVDEQERCEKEFRPSVEEHENEFPNIDFEEVKVDFL